MPRVRPWAAAGWAVGMARSGSGHGHGLLWTLTYPPLSIENGDPGLGCGGSVGRAQFWNETQSQ